MTPLEKMAKAFWENHTKVTAFETLGAKFQSELADNMRAALLALAEAKLPVNIIGAGAAKIGGVRAEHGDGRHLWEARAAFPAMCRAIAESGR